MKFIIGKKGEMTTIWRNGEDLAVTKVQAGPCVVSQIKDEKNDGYNAVQIAYGTRKEKNIKKPQKGHMKDLGNFHFLREFRTVENVKRGDVLSVETFEIGDNIEVTSTSKGKGFQGVVKRYGFKGHNTTHGTKDQVRMPGSIGATGPAHVFKGTRMAGRMGGDRVTIKNLEVVDIDVDNNILFIKGGVPGSKNSVVLISGKGDLKIKEVKTEKEEEKVVEVVAEEEVVTVDGITADVPVSNDSPEVSVETEKTEEAA